MASEAETKKLTRRDELRSGGHLAMPWWVLRRDDLSQAEKNVTAFYIDELRENETAWPGPDTTADLLGIGLSTVKEAIRSLKTKGILIPGGLRRSYGKLVREYTVEQAAAGGQNLTGSDSDPVRNEPGQKRTGSESDPRQARNPTSCGSETNPNTRVYKECKEGGGPVGPSAPLSTSSESEGHESPTAQHTPTSPGIPTAQDTLHIPGPPAPTAQASDMTVSSASPPTSPDPQEVSGARSGKAAKPKKSKRSQGKAAQVAKAEADEPVNNSHAAQLCDWWLPALNALRGGLGFGPVSASKDQRKNLIAKVNETMVKTGMSAEQLRQVMLVAIERWQMYIDPQTHYIHETGPLIPDYSHLTHGAIRKAAQEIENYDDNGRDAACERAHNAAVAEGRTIWKYPCDRETPKPPVVPVTPMFQEDPEEDIT